MKRNPECNGCELHVNAINTICLWGAGPTPAPLMLIGEAPGMNEDRQGLPFVGQAGVLLDNVLARLGLDRSRIYITNVIKCRPVDNKLPTGQRLTECLEGCWPYLETEIQTVDPKVILLMGGTALKFLTEFKLISRHEGMEVETIYEGARTFVAYHPAFVLRQPSKEANLGRALAQAAKAAGLKVKPKGMKEVGLYPYEVRT